MANISSFFGGSGGSGLSTDFTKNDYGVPLPQYITRVDYKDSCTVTVCPGQSMCCRGIGAGGIIPVRDNIFVAVGVEAGLGGTQDCTRAYAMAFCIDDSTGTISSGMTEFKCIFKSASNNDRFAWEVETPGVGDGCCRAYLAYTCNGVAKYLILCTNSSFNCIGTSTPVCGLCTGSRSLTYNGVPGQILGGNASSEDCMRYIRFCNGNVCFNGALPIANPCNLDGGNTGRGHYALSPNTILAYGLCMCGGDCACQKTVLFNWSDTCNCFRMSYCKADSLGNIQSTNAKCCLMCCSNPGKMLRQSYRVGSTWYVEGGGAQWFRQETPSTCPQCFFNTCAQCSMVHLPTWTLMTWSGQAHWHTTQKGLNGCIAGSNSSHFATMNEYDFTWSNNGCLTNRQQFITTQVNGTLGPGVSPPGCCAYNCGQFGSGYKQEGFGSWARQSNVTDIMAHGRTPIVAYPIPMFCNCYFSCCFHFLTSQVVGCKWIVTMEARNCGACECVTLHSYKIMTNSCTAD